MTATVRQPTDLPPGVRTLSIGHGRDPAARLAAAAFADTFQRAGGEVLAVVDWPERAASWLKAARRLAAGAPDAWLVVPPAPGWARVRERLRDTAGWDPARTYVLLTAEGADGGDHLGG
ncbi:MAG: hypothetical protein ACJ73S_22780 [Mycobacteriales bacterium]